MTEAASVLGHKVAMPNDYAPEVLVAVPRALGRASLNLPPGPLPFFGEDLWNAYELSWRDLRGVPQVAVAILRVPVSSPNIVESKSLKLYMGSLHRRRFAAPADVVETIVTDLQPCIGAEISLQLVLPDDFCGSFGTLEGMCVDGLELPAEVSLETDLREPDAKILQADTKASFRAPTQRLTTRLLRSLCPVTSQPDYADVQVRLTGARLQPATFLHYIVSFAAHTGFHEQCVERIFMDIWTRLQPQELVVYARYTRRGGIDINPWRSSAKSTTMDNCRTFRQ